MKPMPLATNSDTPLHWLNRRIGGHNDIWSPTTMEMYAALFRLVRWTAEN